MSAPLPVRAADVLAGTIPPEPWEVVPAAADVRRRGTGALHNRAAEQVVLAGLMRDFAGVYPALARVPLADTDLYWHQHRVAWRALVALYDAAQSADELPGPWTLYRRLSLSGELAEWWSFPAWVGECYSLDPTGCWTVPAAALVVRPLADRRRVVHAANVLLRDAYDGVKAPDEYRAEVELLAMT